MSNTALYYPYIKVPQGMWLKSSLLLWDKISTIVPRGAVPAKSHISHQLKEKGLIEFIDPMSHYDVICSDDFSEGFKSLFEVEGVIKYLKGEISTDDDWDTNGSGFTNAIHTDKISHTVRHFLIDEHNAKIRHGWLDCDPKIADLYMTYLASKISNIWFANPLTNFSALESLLDSVDAHIFPGKARSKLANIATELEAYIPAIPDDFSVARLIRFKKNHEDAYNRFRIKLLNFKAKIAKAKEPEEIDLIVENFRYDLNSSINQIAETSKEHKFDLVHATLRTVFSVSSVVATIIVVADPGKILGPSLAGVTLAYKFGEELRKIRLERESTLAENQFSYLYSIGKQIGYESKKRKL